MHTVSLRMGPRVLANYIPRGRLYPRCTPPVPPPPTPLLSRTVPPVPSWCTVVGNLSHRPVL